MKIKISSDDLFALLDVLGSLCDDDMAVLEDDSMKNYLLKAISNIARDAGSDTLLAQDTIGESILEYKHRFSEWTTGEDI